jgi:hypothetical protein
MFSPVGTTRVGKWLSRVFVEVDWDVGVNIIAGHYPSEGPPRTIRTWPIGKLPDERDFDGLVEEITNEARVDAEQLGGRQRYLFRAVAHGREISSITVRHDHDMIYGGTMDSEPVSEKGIAAQMGRFAEGSIRLLLESQASILGSLERQLQQRDNAFDSAMRKNFEVLALLEKTLRDKVNLEVGVEDRKVAREIEAMKSVTVEERKTKLFDEFVGKLSPLLPVLASQFMGKGLGVEAPVAPSFAADLARGAFSKMTDAEFEQLRSVLAPAQFAAAAELRRIVTATGVAQAPAGVPMPPAPTGGASSAAPPVVPWPPHLLLHALLILREGLLRYVSQQLATGQKVVLPGEQVMQVDVLRRFMAAVSPSTYAELIGQAGMLEDAERVALEYAVKELGLKPGASEPLETNTELPKKG